MKTFDRKEQFWAFLLLCMVIGTMGIAPLIASVYLEKQLPDSLIATLDKTISGLIGVLGAAGAMLFRPTGSETALADTSRKLADKIPPVAQETDNA